MLKSPNLIKDDPLWGCRSVRGYGRNVHAKIWPWGTPWDPIYHHFWDLCQSSNSKCWKIWSIWRSMDLVRYPIVFLEKFPVEWYQNYVWGPIFDPSYDHFWVLCQSPNCQYWEFSSIWGSMDPGRYPIVFLMKFPVEWHRNYVWGPIFDPSYDHFTKCKHLG